MHRNSSKVWNLILRFELNCIRSYSAIVFISLHLGKFLNHSYFSVLNTHLLKHFRADFLYVVECIRCHKDLNKRRGLLQRRRVSDALYEELKVADFLV